MSAPEYMRIAWAILVMTTVAAVFVLACVI